MIQLGKEPVKYQERAMCHYTCRSFFSVFYDGRLTYYDCRIIVTMTVVVTMVVV